MKKRIQQQTGHVALVLSALEPDLAAYIRAHCPRNELAFLGHLVRLGMLERERARAHGRMMAAARPALHLVAGAD